MLGIRKERCFDTPSQVWKTWQAISSYILLFSTMAFQPLVYFSRQYHGFLQTLISIMKESLIRQKNMFT